MKTIEIYEKTNTIELQNLLIEFEKKLENNELLIDKTIFNRSDYDELKRISDDYEIDISLIRMELNKRLWKNE